MYQYIKIFLIVILLLFSYKHTKEFGYIAWALLFTYLLFDDAISIHERVDMAITSVFHFEPAFNLRPVDYGELIVTAISATLLLSYIGLHYLRGSSTFKSVSRDLILLIIVLTFFGIVVDILHISVWKGSKAALTEDGGEMIVISLITWYLFLLNKQKNSTNYTLYRLATTAISRH